MLALCNFARFSCFGYFASFTSAVSLFQSSHCFGDHFVSVVLLVTVP